MTLGSSGAFILIYIALWIFVPEARTTAEKLAMRGEPVNISNIERKIKEGFDDVSGRVKNFDYEKYGYKARSGAGTAAKTFGDVLNFILQVFVKFIGILLLIIAGAMLILLFIGLFTVGTFGIIEAPWNDYLEMTSFDGNALWSVSLLTFFAVGIPFFFLFILGLKILVSHLRSIGRTAKLVLLGLWIISVLGLLFFGIKQATERAFDGEVVTNHPLPISKNDTLYINMRSNPNFQSFSNRRGNFEIKFDENNEKKLYSDDVRFIVRSTKDTLGKVEIVKTAEGKNHREARERAANIIHNISFSGNRLLLDNFLTTNMENKFRDQSVQLTLYLPEGSVLYAGEDTYSFHRNYDYFNDILKNGDEEQYLKITDQGTVCLDCPEAENEEDPWDHSDLEENWGEK